VLLTPRYYQSDMVAGVRDCFRRKVRRVLLVASTGAGKTVIAAMMQGGAAERGGRTWFIVHRREIILETYKKFISYGIDAGLVLSGYPMNPAAMVQVCGVGSLVGRMGDLPQPDGIVWDEAHHIAAATHSRIFNEQAQAWSVGLTATPRRLDGQGLDSHFDTMIEGPPMRRLMDEGYLCDYRYFDRGGADLAGVRSTGGDWNRGDLGEVMGKPNLVGQAVDHYCGLIYGKRAISFEASLKASRESMAAYKANGIEAAHIDGTMHYEQRREIIEAFEAAEIKVLLNVDIAGEGVDIPGVEAVIHRRPTKSLGFYLQANGRAFRLSEGKEWAYILDHAGNRLQHGMPDDPYEWSLAGAVKRAKGPNDDFGVKQCLECYQVARTSAKVCGFCGEEFPIQPRRIEQIEGELTEVDKAMLRQQLEAEKAAEKKRRLIEEKACKTLSELVQLERARGYSNGWAAMTWKRRLAAKNKSKAR
jgi:superfamily II DNA or RNA helicase